MQNTEHRRKSSRLALKAQSSPATSSSSSSNLNFNNTEYRTGQGFSLELLLLIFSRLETNAMVRMMGICKEWFEIIDKNKMPWKALVLPEYWTLYKREDELDLLLKCFNLNVKKSGEDLREVSLPLPSDEKAYAFMKELERCKHSLRTLCIKDKGNRLNEVYDAAGLLSKFPNLSDLRITGQRQSSVYLVDGVENSDSRKTSSLKVLWTENLGNAFELHSSRLDNLSSLYLRKEFPSAELRKLLEKPSQTLKHLSITLFGRQTPPPLPILHFPSLKVLEVKSEGLEPMFPSWLVIPYSSTMICDNVPSALPSISKLMLPNLEDFTNLIDSCPLLSELWVPIYINYQMAGITPRSPPAVGPALIDMLQQREEKVKAGLEINGIKMTQIKTLSVPFSLLGEGLSDVRELVEEVIDWEGVFKLEGRSTVVEVSI